VAISFKQGRGLSDPLELDGLRQVDLTLRADRPIDPSSIASRRTGPWPLARRWLVEARDRIQPLR
jgi:hypothetical protein